VSGAKRRERSELARAQSAAADEVLKNKTRFASQSLESGQGVRVVANQQHARGGLGIGSKCPTLRYSVGVKTFPSSGQIPACRVRFVLPRLVPILNNTRYPPKN